MWAWCFVDTDDTGILEGYFIERIHRGQGRDGNARLKGRSYWMVLLVYFFLWNCLVSPRVAVGGSLLLRNTLACGVERARCTGNRYRLKSPRQRSGDLRSAGHELMRKWLCEGLCKDLAIPGRHFHPHLIYTKVKMLIKLPRTQPSAEYCCPLDTSIILLTP